MIQPTEGAAGQRPPAARLADAREALRTAHYDRALELSATFEEWQPPLNEQGALIRVEILTRRDPVLALEELARICDLFVTPEGIFEYRIASGKAYGSARNFDAAAGMFAEAATLAAHMDRNSIGELGYQQARLKWLRRQFEPECPELTVALSNGSADTRVKTLLVRCWLYAGLERYDKQIEDLRAALETAEEAPNECDAHAVALCIHALARIASETGDRVAVLEAEAAYEKMDWTPDIDVERFNATRALAWDAFLEGHSARAQWLFKDSKEIAPTPAWRVMAHLDRAFIARMNLNEIWAHEELLSAHKLARQVQWADTRGEERNALMQLAILFAETDMAQAQRYVSMYIGLGMENISPTIAVDRRTNALQRYASGRVHQVLGNKELAQTCFEAAYEFLSEVKHHYRAGLAAWALFEVTGDAKWHAAALKHAEHFPKSPVYERIVDAKPESPQQDPFAGMTSLQREIALALCHGMDLAELAQRFSRSAVTIAKQVDSVYAALGVTTRNELRAELQNRGVFL
jgi:tetratricopeptide (TPR) repeat protein